MIKRFQTTWDFVGEIKEKGLSQGKWLTGCLPFFHIR